MRFKDRLISKEPLIGTFLKTPSPMVCEVLGRTSLDTVCIDTEHSPFDRGTQDLCTLALRAADMPVLVRVPSARSEHILNALDCGADGVVIPHVLSAEMARNAVQQSHFGANGRGYAGSSRAAKYTGKGIAEHLKDSRENTVVIAQIEDLHAFEDLDGIAQVDGIDCLFVGRIDLTVALGCSDPKDKQVVDLVEQVCEAGRRNNKVVGMFVGDLSEIPHWISRGATFFLLASDHSFILQGAETLVRSFESAKQSG